MKFELEVGNEEKHTVVFNHNRFWGRMDFYVDGIRIPVKGLPIFSTRLEFLAAIMVGDKERHEIRVQLVRPLLLSGFRKGWKYNVSIDGEAFRTFEDKGQDYSWTILSGELAGLASEIPPTMRLSRRVYTTRREKADDFIGGFVGWWFFNMVLCATLGLLFGLLGRLIMTVPSETRQNFAYLGYVLPCGIPALINIVVLMFLFSPRRYIVFGALVAFVTSMMVTGLFFAISLLYFFVFIFPKISSP